MRKVLAILLVLCMVCTMSVVAFAANPITKDTEQIGSTIVKTIGQGPTDPDVPGANEDYTVTIPAELIDPRRAACNCDDRFIHRCAAHGQEQRDHPPPARRGNTWQRHGDLLG